MTLLAVVAILALVALTGSVLYAARVFSRPSEKQEPVSHSEETEDRFLWLERMHKQTGERMEALTLAVSDGIARVDRADKRIQKTVTSARRLIRENGLEHAGIEAEYEELQSGDDEPSGGGEVLPLYEEVAPPTRSGIPGMSSYALARIREARNV